MVERNINTRFVTGKATHQRAAAGSEERDLARLGSDGSPTGHPGGTAAASFLYPEIQLESLAIPGASRDLMKVRGQTVCSSTSSRHWAAAPSPAG